MVIKCKAHKQYFLPGCIFACIFFLSGLTSHAQFYLRGEVVDEKKNLLANVRMLSHSQKSYYYSGSSGSFGISMRQRFDSLTLTLDGYETVTYAVDAQKWQSLVMKQETAQKNQLNRKVISVYEDYVWSDQEEGNASNETYLRLFENPFVPTSKYAKSNVSLNVNKASYSNVRRFLNNELKVPIDAVRLEEMINYYNLRYQQPGNDSMFHLSSTLTPCPWDETRQLLYIGLSAKKLDMKNVPPGNFVFLIDASGSMDQPNRLPLIKAAFRLFVEHLRPTDTVSIVTYGGDAMVWLSPTSGANKSRIMDAIESLEAEGDTPGESAIKLAYRMARASFVKGGINRVIIATDGDFNVGETSEKALEDLVSREKAAGIYLTCMGVGIGNLKDSKLQVMAKKGNGNYVYLDDIKEAEKVFMRELTQTICVLADNATVSIQFNPNVVAGYRLIGFDNEKEDLASGEAKLEGGQVGSASSTILMYELETKSTEPILGNLTLHYQLPNDTKMISEYYPLDNTITSASALHPDYKFINAITMFGLRIRKSAGSKTKDWKFINTYWQTSGVTTNHFTTEFSKMMEKASKLYPDKKKRKKFLFF